MGKYFGTDGVRGRANHELTAELAFRLGRAAAMVLAREHGGEQQRPLVLIGKDTRISGDMLEAALAAGIAAAGCDVELLGVLPTPGVAMLTRCSGAAAGAVISASHNPYYDNGIKFFATTGFKLPDQVELEIEQLIDASDLPQVADAGLGRIHRSDNAAELYRNWLIGQLSPPLHGLTIVVDAANGAASDIAAPVLSLLGAKVISIHDEPDGININDNCGSTHLTSLCQRVVDSGADLGLAFDGDADRLLAVDEMGSEIDGDQIMAILAAYLRRQGRLANDTLVITVMSNMGLRLAMEQAGIRLEETAVGDRYVLERMLEQQLSLGGEQSGHIILREFSTTGDGMLAALLLLSALVEQGGKMSELAAVMKRLPQVLRNVRVRSKEGWQEQPQIKAAAEQVSTALAGRGRLLLRASGTEPLLRVMVEGDDLAELEQLAAQLAETIAAVLG